MDISRRRFLSLLVRMSLAGYASIKYPGAGNITKSLLTPNIDENTFLLIEPLRFFGKEQILLSLDDIVDLKLLPVCFGNNLHVKSVELTSKSSFIDVSNCKEYEDAINMGYSASTTFSITLESWLKHYCTLLHFLSTAKHPVKKHSVRSSIDMIDDWPAKMLPKPSDRKNTDNNIRVKSLNDYKIVKKSFNKIIIERNGMNYFFAEAARADFTGNGLEEFFVYRYASASHGTFRFSDCALLSFDAVTGRMNAKFISMMDDRSIIRNA